MRRFEELTRAGQVRRMKYLAETALAAYDFGDLRLTPLAHFFNTTFRIDTLPQSERASSGSPMGNKGERYVIRIHRSGAQNVQAIQSELLWLQALRHETGLVVPEPMPTRGGSLVTSAYSSGVPESRQCVVFRWVDGRFLRSRLGPKEMMRVGMFMAKLHRHAEHFIVPEGFFRPRWDYDGLRSGALGTDLEQSWRHLSREDRNVLDAVGERVRDTMRALGEERDVFGLIHADLYENNFLFSSMDVRAIDFDGCGWGHYLFDIGVTFSTLLARDDYPTLRKAFLEGYRQVRPLSPEHEGCTDTFIAARLMCHILWLAAHVDEPSYGTRSLRRITYELGELKAFLRRQQ